MIEIKIGEYFIAVPLTAVCRNGMYMRSLNTGEMPYRGSWNLVSMLDGFAVDGEGGGPYLYRELEEARQDGEELEARGEHSTCRGVVTIPGRVKVEEITFDEVVERIGKVLAEMDGQDLADLYNQSFGSGMEYCGDGVFRQGIVQAPDQEPTRQLYMRITSPNGIRLDDTPVSDELDFQDGCYGLVELCEEEFDVDDVDGLGIAVANRIGRNLRDQLKEHPTWTAEYFGFKAALVDELGDNSASLAESAVTGQQEIPPKQSQQGYADLSRLTPAQILQGAEGMADEFYRLEGWKPPMESYRSTGNPRAVRIWGQVKIAYERLAATSLDDVVSELDEGEDPKL